MKTIFKMMLLTAALTTVWGCSSDDKESDGGNNTFSTVEKPSWKVDLTGHEDKPDWTMPDAADYESDMFLLVRLQDELAASSSDDDCMAVFINGECRTLLAEPNTDKEGNIYFVMRIWGNSAERGVKFALNYYSGGLHRLFTLEGEETFESEKNYGFDEDFVPPLLTAFSKYPVQHSLTVSLPGNVPFTPAADDRVAVFAGDECRGAGKPGRAFTVFQNVAGEPLQLRYYSAQGNAIYTMKQVVNPNEMDSITLAF
jgi:hypothetical protein